MQCKRCSKELVPEFKDHCNNSPWENGLNVVDLGLTVYPGYGEFIDDDRAIHIKSWPENSKVYFCHDCAVLLLSFFSPEEQQKFKHGHQQLGDCTPECPYGFVWSEEQEES